MEKNKSQNNYDHLLNIIKEKSAWKQEYQFNKFYSDESRYYLIIQKVTKQIKCLLQSLFKINYILLAQFQVSKSLHPQYIFTFLRYFMLKKYKIGRQDQKQLNQYFIYQLLQKSRHKVYSLKSTFKQFIQKSQGIYLSLQKGTTLFNSFDQLSNYCSKISGKVFPVKIFSKLMYSLLKKFFVQYWSNSFPKNQLQGEILISNLIFNINNYDSFYVRHMKKQQQSKKISRSFYSMKSLQDYFVSRGINALQKYLEYSKFKALKEGKEEKHQPLLFIEEEQEPSSPSQSQQQLSQQTQQSLSLYSSSEFQPESGSLLNILFSHQSKKYIQAEQKTKTQLSDKSTSLEQNENEAKKEKNQINQIKKQKEELKEASENQL